MKSAIRLDLAQQMTEKNNPKTPSMFKKFLSGVNEWKTKKLFEIKKEIGLQDSHRLISLGKTLDENKTLRETKLGEQVFVCSELRGGGDETSKSNVSLNEFCFYLTNNNFKTLY